MRLCACPSKYLSACTKKYFVAATAACQSSPLGTLGSGQETSLAFIPPPSIHTSGEGGKWNGESHMGHGKCGLCVLVDGLCLGPWVFQQPTPAAAEQPKHIKGAHPLRGAAPDLALRRLWFRIASAPLHKLSSPTSCFCPR